MSPVPELSELRWYLAAAMLVERAQRAVTRLNELALARLDRLVGEGLRLLLIYCQHSMGLGHLVRSWAIADALSATFRVVFVSGGEAPAGMTPPARVEMVQLPALQQTTAGEIVTATWPKTLFSPTFAVGRAAGWCAHVAEQRAHGRLIRPASRYVGKMPG